MSETTLGDLLPPELNPRGRPPVTPRRRRAARVVSWLAIVMSMLILVGSGTIYALYKKYDGNIDRLKDVFCKGDDCDRPAKVTNKVTNFLIIGSDSRDDVPRSEWKRLGLHKEAGRRSDTMLLVHIPADHAGAYVLSFPRDLYVDIPGHGKDRINAAFSLGGPALTVKTVEQISSVRIDHYLEVNFLAFAKMVDALGGVEVCIPQAMKSRDAKLDIAAGTRKLDGPTALAYVRARKFDRDSEYKSNGSDLGRIKRQQQFLGAMIRTTVSSKTLLRPDRVVRLLDRTTKSLKADKDLKFGDLKNLALRFRDLDPKKVVFASVPTGPDKRINGKAVIEMDAPAAAEVFAGVADGSILAGKKKAPAAPKLTVPPSNIRVQVLNGNGVKGQAGQTATALRSLGFVVIGRQANADASTYPETIVRHGPTKAESARTLAAAIPGARIEPDATLTGSLVVVVGKNYTRVQPVKVAGTGTPTKPKEATVTAADNPCQ